jgi:uncharacterized protein
MLFNHTFKKSISPLIHFLLGASLLLTTFPGIAQEESESETTPSVQAIGKAEKEAIVLRWAPTSPTLWELCNTYGYRVERYTVTRGRQYLGNKERLMLTPEALKPLPLEQWEALATNNSFVEIAAEAIYGETFELSTSFEQDVFEVYQKAKELESRFSFALFAADMSKEVATASGLYLRDAQVKEGEKYLYRIYANLPSSISIQADTGLVYIGLDDYIPLPKIEDVNAVFDDHAAMISWNTRETSSLYSAYWVERSEDGTTYKPVTELPYVNIHPENRPDPGIAFKLDSLPQNNKPYWYRVMGLTPFGESGPPSEAVSGQGVPALGATPAIRKVEPIGNQALLRWEFPAESEAALRGFEVERSSFPDRKYEKVSPLILPTERTWQDSSPRGTNYYRIKALGQKDAVAYSFPTLFQLEDSIPPIAPKGLIGQVDSTGKVTLQWTSNTEEDLAGYYVYSSHFKDSEFTRITNYGITSAAFSEEISLRNLTKDIFYKVQAFDTRYNVSEFSNTIQLIKPDILPPVAPVINQWETDGDKLTIRWISSASKDVAYHEVILTEVPTKQVLHTKKIPLGVPGTYQFAGLKAGKYDATVTAIDSSGNRSVSKGLEVAVSGGERKGLENIKITANRTSKLVALSWKFSDPTAEQIIIYRAEDEEAVSFYKTLSPEKISFEDTRVEMNRQYTYYLKVVYKDGEESGLSKKMEVRF